MTFVCGSRGVALGRALGYYPTGDDAKPTREAIPVSQPQGVKPAESRAPS